MTDETSSSQGDNTAARPNPGWISRRIRDAKRQRHQRRTEKEHQSATDRASRSTAWATWAIAILTFATIGVGISQWIVFNRQLGEMRATRESADNSFTAQLAVMQAQTKAIEGQLDQMRMQQRAFITASAFRIEKLDQSSRNDKSCWRFTPIIINTGVTPTKNMRMFTRVTYEPQFTLPFGGLFNYAGITSLIFAPSDPDRVFRRFSPWTRSVLGPKQELPDPPGNDTVCLTEQSGGNPFAPWRYYASGVIHYNDTFPGTQEHITKYCFWIQARADGDAFKATPVLCSHWNCADDECEADERNYKEDVQRAFGNVGKPVPSDFYVDEPPLVLQPIPDEERGKPQR